MCEALASHAQTLYSPSYRPCTCRPCASKDDAIDLDPSVLDLSPAPYGDAVRAALDPAHALVIINLTVDDPGSRLMDKAAELEAGLVACLVGSFDRATRDWDLSSHTASRVFVVTPHHTQRLAVNRALEQVGVAGVQVDTVERMQGKERDLVVVCLAYQDQDRLEAELDFVYSLPRLNVSVTRARKKVVVILSDLTRKPGLSILSSPTRRQAFEFLESFVALSTSTLRVPAAEALLAPHELLLPMDLARTSLHD